MTFRALPSCLLAASTICSAGCAQVLGLEDFKEGKGGAGGGSATTSTSADTTATTTATTSTAASSSSTGGSCEPNATVKCYTGTPITDNVGSCKPGTQTCDPDGMGYSACVGDILPKPETCKDDRLDEDCDHAECVTHARSLGDSANQTIDGLGRDAMGNIFIAGTLAGTIQFDATHTISAVGTQIYLAKLDAGGGYLWAKVFASSGPVSVSGLAVDSNGAVILTGNWTGNQLSFGGAALDSYGYGRGYLAKLAGANGAHVFSTSVLGDDYAFVAAPAVDGANNIYVWGENSCGQSCVPATDNFFLHKRSPSGALTWFKNYTDAPSSGTTTHTVRRANAVATDPFGNVWVTGAFKGTEALGGTSITSAGGFDMLVAKIDESTGNTLSKSQLGDASDQFGSTIVSDGGGNVFVGGNFAGKITLGSNILQSQGALDMCVVEFPAVGFGGWAKSFGAPGDQLLRALAVAGTSLVFSGQTTGNVDYGGGVLTGGGGLDVPLVKLDTQQGSYSWSRVFGDSADQSATALIMAADGTSVLGITGAGVVDFGGLSGTPAGGTDAILASFAP